MSFLLTQFGSQVPVLLVYGAAFVLSLMFMSRARVPAILTLVGLLVLVATTIVVGAVQAMLIQSREVNGGGVADFARLMALVGFAGSFFRAAGLALLIAAIFVGRRPAFASPQS